MVLFFNTSVSNVTSSPQFESLFYDECINGQQMTGYFTRKMASPDCVGIATYNFHGLNNGRSGLLDLCNNSHIHIIAVQEHWLSRPNSTCLIACIQILWVLIFPQ